VADALARFAAFLRADDQVCCWGRFALDLLQAEGCELRLGVNLRDAAARALGRSPGGPEQAARALAGNGDPRRAWSDGRAGRRIASLGTIVDALLGSPAGA
jgi:hypothetical protein